MNALRSISAGGLLAAGIMLTIGFTSIQVGLGTALVWLALHLIARLDR